jgi:hypothetical protein
VGGFAATTWRDFFTRERERVKEGLHGGLSEAPLALMGPGLVELSHPEIEVGLQVLDRLVELLAEGDAIKLVEHGLVEALDDAVIRYEGISASTLVRSSGRRYGETIRVLGRWKHESAGRPT